MRGLPPRIALIGFMGSGKTTVGRLLAQRLGFRFRDLDDLIEAAAGRYIRDIFTADGEAGFRALESRALAGQGDEERLVLACGGGAAAQECNSVLFREKFFCVYLEVSFQEFLRRTAGDPARPLLARPREEIQKLYDNRLPAYRTLGDAGCVVATDNKSPAAVTAEILTRLGAAL